MSTPDIAEFVENHGVDLSWVDSFYTWMHENPELSEQEEQTAAHIQSRLAQLDCEVTTGIGGHGITAVWRNGDGPAVLYRADFDALPVTEDTGASYASKNVGVMHACGHDVHTSALIGLCEIMDTRRDVWSGTFIALFQPAEEVTRGAGTMIRDGLADKIPAPQVCLGQHIMPGPVGTVYSAPGPVMAACDTLTVTLHGVSSHASAPHNSIDPTFLAAMIVVRLQGIVGREIPAEEFGVVSVGTLSAGHTNNTIPDTATLVLNCRFYDTDVRDRTYAAIERVIQAECLASGTPKPADIAYSARGELTDNDPGVHETVRPVFDEVFGEASVDAMRWTASEDFSEIPRHFDVPYEFWLTGCTDRDSWDAAVSEGRVSEIPGNHSPHFLPAPGTIDAATRSATAAVLAYLWR
ncbi:MAG TPA: amidohydrolase [Candidatus Corynebacterium faecigallinarum]|uniref:Amidohydrolase n=1 Tax=Candidatus Corynebacterium faecigallinarum TaxID=2838528 RepID=A0A9D2QIU6_9CORY|nr:amidohydrolase [Candidatus Corynebacterium faecigallinarum]